MATRNAPWSPSTSAEGHTHGPPYSDPVSMRPTGRGRGHHGPLDVLALPEQVQSILQHMSETLAWTSPTCAGYRMRFWPTSPTCAGLRNRIQELAGHCRQLAPLNPERRCSRNRERFYVAPTENLHTRLRLRTRSSDFRNFRGRLRRDRR